MMVIIHGLPSEIRYQDIKKLIKDSCDIEDFILDNLSPDEFGLKKMRVGLADDEEGSIVICRLDGYQLGGKILRVVPYGKSAKKTGQNQPPQNFNEYGNQNPQGNFMEQERNYAPQMPNSDPWAANQKSWQQPAQMGQPSPNVQPGYGNAFHGQGGPGGAPFMDQNNQFPSRERYPGPGQPLAPGPQYPGNQSHPGRTGPLPQPPRPSLRNMETMNAPMNRDSPNQGPFRPQGPNFRGPDGFAPAPFKVPGAKEDQFGMPQLDLSSGSNINQLGFRGQPPMNIPQNSPWGSQKPLVLPRSRQSFEDECKEFEEMFEKPRFDSREDMREDFRRDGGRRISPGRTPFDAECEDFEARFEKPRFDNRKSPPRRDDFRRDGGRRISPDKRQTSPSRRMPPFGRSQSPGRRNSPYGRPISPGPRQISPSRRISPPRRITPPRRISPMRRMSPNGRRLSPYGRQMSPSNRRMSPSGRMNDPHGRRMSPHRRISPGNRISPNRRIASPSRQDVARKTGNDRYSPSRLYEDKSHYPTDSHRVNAALKQVRPAYEPVVDKAPNEPMFSGGYHPKITENVQYPIRGVTDPQWQSKVRVAPDVYQKSGEDSRFPREDKPRSRSPTRRDKSLPRDRYRKNSRSRSPRRSWNNEKRRSPVDDIAPPPPSWPGASRQEDNRPLWENQRQGVDDKKPVWDTTKQDRRETSRFDDRNKRDDGRFDKEHRFERPEPPASRDYPNRGESSGRKYDKRTGPDVQPDEFRLDDSPRHDFRRDDKKDYRRDANRRDDDRRDDRFNSDSKDKGKDYRESRFDRYEKPQDPTKRKEGIMQQKKKAATIISEDILKKSNINSDRVQVELEFTLNLIIEEFNADKNTTADDLVMKFYQKFSRVQQQKILKDVLSCLPKQDANKSQARKRSSESPETKSKVARLDPTMSKPDTVHEKLRELYEKKAALQAMSQMQPKHDMVPMVPPQMVPPQMVPPQMVPPQMVPPQMVPPQMVPPQMVPPQMVPPQMVPPQMVPPQMVPPASFVMPTLPPSSMEEINQQFEESFKGHDLYLCKDNFEPISSYETPLLREFVVSQIYETASKCGWTPTFTLRGLKSLHRYEVYTEDDQSKEWLLNLDFSSFTHFNVLVYTNEELWYERAAIWLPGHSNIKMEPFQKLLLQNKHHADLQFDKWKFVKQVKNYNGHRVYVDMPPASARAFENHKMMLSYELQQVHVYLKAVAVDKNAFDAQLNEKSSVSQADVNKAIRTAPVPMVADDAKLVKIRFADSRPMTVNYAREIQEMITEKMYYYPYNHNNVLMDFEKYGICRPHHFAVMPCNPQSRKWLLSMKLGDVDGCAVVVEGAYDFSTQYLRFSATFNDTVRRNYQQVLEALARNNRKVKKMNISKWKAVDYKYRPDKDSTIDLDIDVESAETLIKQRFKLRYDKSTFAYFSFKGKSLYAILKKLKNEMRDHYVVTNMDLDSDDDVIVLD